MNTRIWFYSRITMRTDIAAEIQKFEKWANEHDAELVGYTFEPITVPLMQRKGINEIINAAECRAIDLIVAESIDYFSRKRSELEPFLKLILENDVTILTKQGRIRLPEYN